jgi:hypothetical protein
VTVGLIYGAYVDGASAGLLVVYVLSVLAILALALWRIGRRSTHKAQALQKPA